MFLAFTRRNRVPEQNTNLPRLLGRKLSPSAVVFCSHGLAWVPGLGTSGCCRWALPWTRTTGAAWSLPSFLPACGVSSSGICLDLFLLSISCRICEHYEGKGNTGPLPSKVVLE